MAIQSSGFQLVGESSRRYERFIPVLLGPSADLLVHLSEPMPGEQVLDLGCGTGFVARRVLPWVPGGTVVGVDINDDMLQAAKQFSPPGIDWQRSDMAALPCPDASFDLVISQHAVQFPPDPALVLAEAHRVLRPGGRFTASVWGRPEESPYHAAMTDAVSNHLDESARRSWPRAYSLSDERLLERLTAQAGFEEVQVSTVHVPTVLPRVAAFVRGHLSATPWSGDFGALPENEQDLFVEAVRTALSAYSVGDHLVVPFAHRVVTGRARY